MANATFASQLQRQTSSISHYFPLLSSPALESDQYAVNHPLIVARTISGIALSFIAMAALYWVCPAAALLVAKYQILPSLGWPILFIEICRAERAADRLAAEEYRNQIPSNKATDRLSSSPRAFQYLLDRNENLNKLDSQGTSLANKILSSWDSSSEVGRMLVDSDIDLLAANPEGVNLFMFAVKSSKSDSLRHILKSRKVQPASINEQDQAAIWKHAKNGDAIKLLCQYGFNIDARDSEGLTPLMHWVQREQNLPLSLAALNAGANPLLQNLQGAKASELAPPNSLLHSLLLQGEREFGNELPLLPKEKGLMAWLPWRPLAYQDSFSYKADSDALLRRIYIVGMGAIALAFIAPSLMLRIVPKILRGLMVISIPHFITELWRGTKEARRQAVIDHLIKPIPSKQSTATIHESVEAARLLIEHSPHPSYLDKIDEQGEHLLGKRGINPEVFKLLVGHGANIFGGNNWNNGFFQAVEDSSSDLLAYILDRRLVNIAEMPVEVQMAMWRSIGSEDAARRLQQYGFNPDVRDGQGNTPLMLLVRERNILGEIPLAKIEALLAVGANPLLANDAGQRARDLAIDPRIAVLFR